MTGPVTTEALVDGDHDMPTDAEIQAMHEEADNFRLPAPAPIPVRDPYYLTGCEHCDWVGSSEQCSDGGAPDYDDVICPVCCSSMRGDAPDEAEAAKHGEAVYQRIVSADQDRDILRAALQQVTAERDEARDLAYELKLAAAGGEDVPGSANLVTAEDVRRWRDEDARQLARLRAEGEAKDRRIAALTEALAPFADAAGLFGPRLSDDYDQSIYAPAAGPEFAISADHLRAARAATAREG